MAHIRRSFFCMTAAGGGGGVPRVPFVCSLFTFHRHRSIVTSIIFSYLGTHIPGRSIAYSLYTWQVDRLQVLVGLLNLCFVRGSHESVSPITWYMRSVVVVVVVLTL